MPPDSPSYVIREADQRLFQWIWQGEYCSLLAGRQVGKSSLIARTCRQLQEQGTSCVLIDLGRIGSTEVAAEQWYCSLVHEICQGLNLYINERQWWDETSPLSYAQRFGEFLRHVVLDKITERIVIFIDEMDVVQDLELADDLFAVIQTMYDSRTSDPECKRLIFVLSGTAQPADLIRDRWLTPYHIGRTLDLQDFDPREARTLLAGLEMVYPDQADKILERVLYWSDGHPYLTQRLCLEVVNSGVQEWTAKDVDRLVEHLFFRRGQIQGKEHLQRIDDYVHKSPYCEAMLSIYRNLLAGKLVTDEARSIAKSQLKLSGLSKSTPVGTLKIRNRVYERVFGFAWAGVHAPEPVSDYIRPESRSGYRKPEPRAASRSSTSPRWPMVVILLVGLVVLIGTGLPIYNFATRPTPTVAIVVLPTDTPSPTSTPSPTPSPTASVPTSTNTYTPRPTSTWAAVVLPTNTYPPIALPTPTNTYTPPPSPTLAPTATDTPMPSSTPVPLVADTSTNPASPVTLAAMPGMTVLPNPTVKASRWASIFALPDVSSKELSSIAPGEQVTVLGRTGGWLYVQKTGTENKGYAWGPYLQWSTLELADVIPSSFCDAQETKRAGLRVEVRGGDGLYTFYWGDQVIPFIEPEGNDSYLVYWPWGTWSSAGMLKVTSGDGQERSWSTALDVGEPACSP